MSRPVRREAILFSTLLAFGLIVLPFAVYFVGAVVFGEYRPGADAFSLVGDVWAALFEGHWAAWLLVTSPYLVVQLLRAAAALWRGPRSVTPVTDSEPDTRSWRL